MDPRQLTPDLAVSPQISPDDVPAIAAAGFRTLINNRPDSEIGADENDAVMRQAAAAAGLDYHYLPFEPGAITPDLIAGFADATTGRKPAFAYCRSGTRCTVLWGLSQAGRRPLDEIMDIASRAGYDLTSVQPLIQSLASRKGA